MGFLREWTDGRFEGRQGPVVRGGPRSARRCAARSRLRRGKPQPTRQLAFRCCHGDRNEAATAKIEAKPVPQDGFEASDLAKIFASVPELTRITEGVRLLDADVKTILSDRSVCRRHHVRDITDPRSPEPGVELLVATGRAKKTGFVIALWPLPDGTYRFASSFLLLNDADPIALAYEPSRRKELRWTTCWTVRASKAASPCGTMAAWSSYSSKIHAQQYVL